MPTPLTQILNHYRTVALTEREKGTYFEELMLCYLRHEASYRDLYRQVWTYGDWAAIQGLDRRDTGIDLVAQVRGSGEYHAVQCKLYAADYQLQKADIDSFFTASGQKPFTHRIIVSTTNLWSEHAIDALRDQQPPVSKIDLHDLETSQIDWSRYVPQAAPVLKPKKQPRLHQLSAINAVQRGLAGEVDRGKLIMACGTGKTFTSLKIAEAMTGVGKRVLFLVPSLSLLSQTLTEWTQESKVPLHSFAVCSDRDVGKKRQKDRDTDTVQTFTHELRYPATTNAAGLGKAMQERHDGEHMSVVFSTYHSIAVLNTAQQQYGLPAFDLVICDEAHRTTGAIFENAEESAFVRIHDADFIRATKRLYMTATPRIYGTSAKITAELDRITLCSMDDVALYGEELYVINFSEAVKQRLLVDYKVIVLAVEEAHVSRRLQELLKDANNQLKMDDAAKIVGCWKALTKHGLTTDLIDDDQPMRRAVAFCQVIEPNRNAKTHKVSSKQIARMFQAVVDAYVKNPTPQPPPLDRRGGVKNPSPLNTPLSGQGEGGQGGGVLFCAAEHVDGSMTASEKEAKLDWLKTEPPAGTCRILSNVRCLSEGVDVPALDAVLFLTPRNSQVDVVQSVGRVMRVAPNKQRGYVILPVVIPAGVEPHTALNDNKTYAVVWQVLQALRSHDDRFDAMINKLELTGPDPRHMEVIAITDNLARPPKAEGGKGGKKGRKGKAGGGEVSRFTIGAAADNYVPEDAASQAALQFEIGEIERAIYAKLVQKVGNRHHWEDWANDIAKIAQAHIAGIRGIIETPPPSPLPLTGEGEQTATPPLSPLNTPLSSQGEGGQGGGVNSPRAAFDAFAKDLRSNLNDSITDNEIIEMLAQHLITKPVFDALFAGHDFTQHNPISRALEQVLTTLHEHSLTTDTAQLQGFYASVQLRAAGIDSAAGRQRIILELYDKFFRNAFPRLTERLGIVYTPVEVVDFILHSVDHLLRQEFGQNLGTPGVQILDPFTGAGAFITRLLQSGLISPEQLRYKYTHDIHANEIVLLAYYIAAINIESVFHSLSGSAGVSPASANSGQDARAPSYVPFPNICLTDTFQLHESADLISELLVDNSTRRQRQKGLDIQVIIGNPPYSAGQNSANDNNQNVAYANLDERIRCTYATHSTATNKNALYDSYIRAIRWASDRIGNRGIIGFITNAGFLESGSADGLRKCLAEEFSRIVVLNLRGNIRKNMVSKGQAKEGQNIFGSGSMAGIAISLFIKNPNSTQSGLIEYYDIGDDLTREEKLIKISTLGSVASITDWQNIATDRHGDWLKQRDDNFNQFIVLGDKKSDALAIFENYSQGIGTSRDSWCFNASKIDVAANMSRMIEFYNSEVTRFTQINPKPTVNDFINTDTTKISWSSSLIPKLVRLKPGVFDQHKTITSLYRPFNKQWLYYDGMFNHRVGQMPRIFPNATVENRVILVNSNWSGHGFIAMISNSIPDLHCNGDSQCFPLYLYETEEAEAGLFTPAPTRRDAITDAALAHFRSAYHNQNITKEDIFYYTYALLHSPAYREQYADNLSKQLPRIPCDRNFPHYTQAGRALAELHINYETAPLYPLTIKITPPPGPLPLTGEGELMRRKLNTTLSGQGEGGQGGGVNTLYRVEKIRYGKIGSDKDLTTLIYNNHITLTGIPIEAYAYIINGKPALDWVIERQGIKTDKASGIVNDANAYAIETMHNPKYPLELIQRIITVSLETMRIVATL